MRRLTLMLVSGALLVAACENNAPPASSGPLSDAGIGFYDAGLSLDASSSRSDAGGSDAGGSCNAITQRGETVTWVSSTNAAPVATGGTPVDGLYILTDFKIYTSELADGTVVSVIGKATAEIAGSTFSVLLTTPGGEDRRNTETLTLSDTNVTATETCRLDASDAGLSTRTGQYSATSTSFTIHFPTPTGRIENVYTKL